MEKQELGIGLLGLGVVGQGAAQALLERGEALAREAGCRLTLKRILVKDQKKQRSPAYQGLLTLWPRAILEDPQVDIIIEAMGGEEPAFNLVRDALDRGKAVVTANKELMAKHGPRLLAMAQASGTELRYEASVGGGIPIIGPLTQDLAANRFRSLHAIINGTTNYILTRMAQEGLDFATALARAQELGYAEPDPKNDLEGTDAAYKLAILATLAFRLPVSPQDVHREGISRLAARDFRYARELGYAIKLLALAKEEDGQVQVRVHPTFLPQDLLLAKVDGVFNAVQVEGDLVGRLLFYGQGAGASPTASALLADVIGVARKRRLGIKEAPALHLEAGKRLKPMAELETRYYIRMSVTDQPGVLAQIARVLGEHGISIASVIQKEADPAAQRAEIVIMTHPSREAAVQQALQEMTALPVVAEVSNLVRVEG